MRKVFLDNLPRMMYKGRLCVDWRKSEGYNVRFIYDNVQGYFKINEYIKKEGKVNITCNIYNINRNIQTDGLHKCKIAETVETIYGISKTLKFIKLCKKKSDVLSKKEKAYFGISQKKIKRGLEYMGYDNIQHLYNDKKIYAKSKRKYSYYDVYTSYSRFFLRYDRFPVNGDYKDKINHLVPRNATVEILKDMGYTIDDLFKKISNTNMNEEEYEYNKTIQKYILICKSLNKVISVHDLQEYIGHDLRWIMSKNKNVKNYYDFYTMCGFKKEQDLTKDEVVKIIYLMRQTKNRPLEYDDFRGNNSFDEVGITTIRNYWGTMNKMKEALGLEIIQEDMVSKHKTNEEMLEDLQRLINELGRIPTSKEIDECDYINRCSNYHRYFGGLNNALIELGYKPNKKCISLNLSNDEIIEIYKDYIEDTDIIPTYEYASKIYVLPSPTTVLRRFDCSWNEFIEKLGYTPHTCIYNTSIAEDGTYCNSSCEVMIHNYLLNKNITNLNKETLYRDILDNEELKSKAGFKRLDWTFDYSGETYYVEYFGLMNYKNYNQRHDDKIKLILDDGKMDNFIAIYPKTIGDLEEIFSFIS